MNKKNKNKNRSKPANPVPSPQKVDAPVVEGTAVLESEKPAEISESLVKECESVVETVSEVTSPTTEENDTTSDTPKKPKRNKAKKKKQEEPNLDEIKLTSVEVPTSEPLPEPGREVIDEGKVEMKESIVEEENIKVEENITPNVRKKKNKKKQSEQQKVEEPVKKVVVEKSDDVKKEETIIDTTIVTETIKPETTEPETRSKKKNKKKKHRHDSEKSDKAEEVVSCTAAFQKLISSTDNEDVVKSTEDTEASQDIVDGKQETPKEETLKELIESVLLSEEIPETEKEQIKDEPSKGKKKHKKDKKQQHKEDIETKTVDDVPIPQEVPVECSTDKLIEEIVKDEGMKGESLSLIENVELESMDTAKPKAKIAKPVEKKRKGKPEPSESCAKASADIIPPEIAKDTERDIQEEKPTERKVESTTSEVKLAESIPSNLEHISPRPTDETTKAEEDQKLITDIVFDVPADTILTDITSTSVETPITENISEKTVKTIDDKMVEEVIQPTAIETTDLLPPQIHIKPETSILLDVMQESEKDMSVSPEPYKTVEKKKKKHHKKIDITNVPAEKTPEHKVLVTPESEQLKEEPQPQKQSEEIFDLPSSGDVEISSLKIDDTEGSSEVTPDFIHHPLATSQQFIDDNNNMLITEITSAEEKLPPPLLFPSEPIIRGSGETPEPFEKMSFTPTIIREKSKTDEPEKTDLKSKMMEVSQDMEELRLSIERSLAELTSMEKTEQEVEIKFEAPEAPTSEIIKKSELCAEKVTEKLEDNIMNIATEPITTKEVPEERKAESENISSVMIPPIIEETNISQVTPEDTTPKIEEPMTLPDKTVIIETEKVEPSTTVKPDEDKKATEVKETAPVAPTRKEHKGKGKGKRKGKQDPQSQQTTTIPESSTTTAESTTQQGKKEEKSEQKQESSESDKNKGKQQSMQLENGCNGSQDVPQDTSSNIDLSFEPIENFEDALTSSVDDVNKTFEMIANEVNTPEYTFQNPEINIIAPDDSETAKSKENPVSPPKNLLGHPDIPVPSNRPDYKKEKNKQPNMRQAKVKIKDAVDIERVDKSKQSKESQTENKRKTNKNMLESFSYMTNGDSEYVYKYSFRKVFLQSLCHVCRKELSQRIPCQFCSLVFYCSQKHKDEDWPQHQSLCFAVCTIVHLKEQKHIFADAKNISGHNYRLLRMQMIVSCEKVLKRKLVPWEQETFLYPRICADIRCREWRQSKLADCAGCGQISYCSEHPDHLPPTHQRWCRSYALYQKLVHHQQTKGRVEPKMPTRILPEGYRIPDKINEALAAMYDEKIDMTDTEYAALTQLATAPLTAAYGHQQATMAHANGMSKKTAFVIHVVGAELQFEADVLYKWEVFFLHLKPDVKELRVVLISPDLNPSQLPLDLLGKVNLCESCNAEARRVLFSFQDKKTYYEYWSSDEFAPPDIVCAFNPSIQRSSIYNGKDTWPVTISCILKLKTPFIISSYSLNELYRDMRRIKECSDHSGVNFKTIIDPRSNPFASVRPDRNFITDDEIPLLFKNYCFAVLCGV